MNPMTLGELISSLERKPPDLGVRYDFMGHYPIGIGSYRGYYEQLALGHQEPNGKSTTVGELLALLRSADGETFTGYKGGEYTMDRNTPVWVGNNGECYDTAIVDVLERSWCIVLKTAFQD